MIVVDRYIINVDTKVILNKYDKFGSLCSLVLEGDEVYEVKESPLSIVENSINFYGHSLQGAIEGARSVLGNISTPPVKVSGKLGMYWFPIKSIKHDDNVWFSINHIKNYFPIDTKTLRVMFHDGNGINIESSFGSFDRKVSRAHKLKNIIENRTNGEHSFNKEANAIQIVRDPDRKHYTYIIKSRNRERDKNNRK